MNTKKNTYRFLAFLLIVTSTSFSYGQIEQYNYKRAIDGISNEWHTIELPNSVFNKVSKNLSDIRIFGITKNNDTIEAPYVLKVSSDKISKNKIVFKSINNVHNGNGYYYTFEIPSAKQINQLNLDFDTTNFDWKLKFEASQNLKEWFTIKDNYRVVSIENEIINYQFTKLIFPNSKYKYYRLLVKSKKNPKLKIAHLDFNTIQKGRLRDYTIANISQNNNKKSKQTTVTIELDSIVPISYLKVNIDSKIDYYRSYKLDYLSSRFKTEKGWKENYNSITNGVLNSIDNNEINFGAITTKKLRLVINNQDNKALAVSSIDCKGYIYKLLVRFDEDANYFLTYGNINAAKPNYDILRFPDKIPTDASLISLGKENVIAKQDVAKTEALFTNKAWLWAVMLVIMVLLTWFSLKMMRNTK